MKDGEIAVITAEHSPLDISRVEIAPENDALLTPAPYPQFTIKECLEQPESIARALSYGARLDNGKIVLGGLDANAKMLENVHNLIISGCGTSLFAAKYGAKLMRDIGAFDTVYDIDSAEVRYYYITCMLRHFPFY
jgi:glucosamine--fructose-6-phosphate aminotransferase (isomerizing)